MLGAVLLGPDGNPIPDIDSVTDANNTDNFVGDDDLNSGGGDEDDHDIATLVLANNEAPPGLAFTGAWTTATIQFAVLLMLLGAVIVRNANKREEDDALNI